jgi:ribosomal protein S14
MKRETGIKKLALSRETLRDLADGQLRGVEGGATSLQYSRCDSCGIVCTVPQFTCTCQ